MGRPLHGSMHTTSVYCNRIWLIGLYFYILGLIKGGREARDPGPARDMSVDLSKRLGQPSLLTM